LIGFILLKNTTSVCGGESLY